MRGEVIKCTSYKFGGIFLQWIDKPRLCRTLLPVVKAWKSFRKQGRPKASWQEIDLLLFKKMANPGLFFIYFRLFKHTLQFLQQINVKNVQQLGQGSRPKKSICFNWWYSGIDSLNIMSAYRNLGGGVGLQLDQSRNGKKVQYKVYLPYLPVWPDKNRQMSIKVAQIWSH